MFLQHKRYTSCGTDSVTMQQGGNKIVKEGLGGGPGHTYAVPGS